MQAQDDGEPFDLVDRDGNPLGISKARKLVHQDGDFHRSVHIWVWGFLPRGDTGIWIVFQRRSRAKDTWPLAIDVAVTGHLRAGETPRDAMREAEEEIGLRLGLSDVVHIGIRRRMDARRPGIIDNEIQDIFATQSPVAIAELRPHPAELEGILALPLEQTGPLLRGEIAKAMALRLVPQAGAPPSFVEEPVRLEDFVGVVDDYYLRAEASVEKIIEEHTPERWRIG